MKVLITGSKGQLGQELQLTKPEGWEIIAYDREGLDVTDKSAVDSTVARCQPDLIINAAAYTAVDRAEEEPELAAAVNTDAARYLAVASVAQGARLIHVSTDFVFDGRQSCPYQPTDPTNPLSVYGATKCRGEEQISAATNGQALILRTSWVYSSHGHNFVKTMLRLMAERDQIGVVSDQIGSPTWAQNLAKAVWLFADKNTRGIYHCTDEGVTNWYDFAVAIQEEALALGLLQKTCEVTPITSADYPTPAKRPVYSVLDNSQTWAELGRCSEHWRVALRGMLAQ